MNVEVSFFQQLNIRIDECLWAILKQTMSDGKIGEALAQFIIDFDRTVILSESEKLILSKKFKKAMSLFAIQCNGLEGFTAFARICRDPNGVTKPTTSLSIV